MPKITRIVRVCLSAGFLLVSNVLQSQEIYPETIESDRPGQAFSAFAVPKNKLQIQVGQNASFQNLSSSENLISTSSDYTFRYGLLPRIDVQYSFRSSWSKVFTENQSREDLLFDGAENDFQFLNLAFRYQILKGKGLLKSAAVYFELSGDDLINGEIANSPEGNSQVRFATKHQVSKKLAFATNLVAINIQSEKVLRQYAYVLNASYNISGKWGVFADLFGSLSENSDTHSTNAGMYFLITPDIQIDFFFGCDYWIRRTYPGANYELSDYPNFNLFGELGASFRLP